MSRFSSKVRTAATLLGFTFVTAAAGLAVAWPHTTYADGDQPIAQYTPEGVKIGEVFVRGELVRDTKSKTGWVVVMVASNKGDGVANVAVETDLTRMVASPMGRVAPVAQAIWNTSETLTLAAHQQVIKRYDVPASIATQVTAAKVADTQAQAQAKQQAAMRTRVVYAVAIKAPQAPTQAAQPSVPVRPAVVGQGSQAMQPMQPMQAMPGAPAAPASPAIAMPMLQTY